MKSVKVEPDIERTGKEGKSWTQVELEEGRSSNSMSPGPSVSSILEQGPSPMRDTCISSSSNMCQAPICRQFWKAGNYDNGHVSKVAAQNGKNYLNVHPKFLHSNATSHKWAFGAIAELIDNAVDEIQNGATFVLVDKTTNPKDGSLALLIQDNGGGMDPDAMRHCMSFGFSEKSSKSAIGQYGNGFKTSTMRLGADVIVFSRHVNDRRSTQSIGLLSFTFLTQTGHDRIIVPMVDYEINTETGKLFHCSSKEHFRSNLSILLQWAPYSTEAELLKQFDDIGTHGTKVIIYNLWFDNAGKSELDFDTDPEDIRIGGEIKKVETRPEFRSVNEEHIANRLQYSLKAYLSILYLRIPDTFKILLRGLVVQHYNLADDLKHPEFILYKPHGSGFSEGEVITTIGFVKEAPKVIVHGFSVYHRNRLILPFWRVVSRQDSKGRGVVGVLQANFMEPTHNKQDFEKTSLFQKLESRLREMTREYWDFHCHLIGYQVPKSKQAIKDLPVGTANGPMAPATLNRSSPVGNINPYPTPLAGTGSFTKRKENNTVLEPGGSKRRAVIGANAAPSTSGHTVQTPIPSPTAIQTKDPELLNLIIANKKLRAQLMQGNKRREDLELKLSQLRDEVQNVQHDYKRLISELTVAEQIKKEKGVKM